MNTVERIDPLADPRWQELLRTHPLASIFHTPGWLEALRRTYGYDHLVFTTSPATAELANGLLFTCINSRLTGRRLVSLPFSDHCEPLVDNQENLIEMLSFLGKNAKRERWKYVEVRPLDLQLDASSGFTLSQKSWIHRLDLSPSLDQLFRSFHKDSIQRKIRRAEREGLTYEEGRSELLLSQFYHLLLGTRRRHKLPPQPRVWFRNLMDCLGDQLKIRVASRDGQPMASILTLTYKNVMTYKYGCSDTRFHNLGPMHHLYWKAIQEARNNGLQQFDMGRTDADNEGLLQFKDRWGATRSALTYLRYPAPMSAPAGSGWKVRLAKELFALMPSGFLESAGKLLYKHVG